MPCSRFWQCKVTEKEGDPYGKMFSVLVPWDWRQTTLCGRWRRTAPLWRPWWPSWWWRSTSGASWSRPYTRPGPAAMGSSPSSSDTTSPAWSAAAGCLGWPKEAYVWDGQTGGWRDGQTDVQTDWRTDGQKHGWINLPVTGPCLWCPTQKHYTQLGVTVLWLI